MENKKVILKNVNASLIKGHMTVTS